MTEKNDYETRVRRCAVKIVRRVREERPDAEDPSLIQARMEGIARQELFKEFGHRYDSATENDVLNQALESLGCPTRIPRQQN